MLTDPARRLRFLLIADAFSSGAFGVLLIVAAAPLSGLLGLPEGLLRVAALLLLPFALFVGWAAAQARPAATAVWVIVVVNVAWAAASGALLIAGGLTPTTLGYVFVVAQALFVFALGETQFLALRRIASIGERS